MDPRLIELRPATPDDHTALLRLWHRGWHDAHASLVPAEVLAFRAPEHFALWRAQSPDRFYVAAEKEVIGFVSLNAAEVVKLYVDATARGTGVARALLDFGEQVLRDEGVEQAQLFCTAGNLRAERFYERAGWRVSHSFEDALWLPAGVAGRFSVATHCYRKTLTPPC